jgi:hypothetical protein
MNLPLSCPDLTAVAVEYVTQRVSAPASLVWRQAHGILGSRAGQSSVHSRAREKCKFVEANSKWPKLLNEWLFEPSRLQRTDQSAGKRQKSN